MGLSFVSAIVFVIVMTLTLPKDDLAHGQMPFADPLVLPIMIIYALISGLIGWPLFVAFGRRVQPARVAKVTWIIVPAFIIIATPFDPALGWPGAYVVCILALIYCAVRFRNNHDDTMNSTTAVAITTCCIYFLSQGGCHGGDVAPSPDEAKPIDWSQYDIGEATEGDASLILWVKVDIGKIKNEEYI